MEWFAAVVRASRLREELGWRKNSLRDEGVLRLLLAAVVLAVFLVLVSGRGPGQKQ